MEKQYLHSRHRQILMSLINRERFVTCQELAAQIEVSDRTVRDDIRLLNPLLGHYGARIETVRGKGARLRLTAPAESLHGLLHGWRLLETPEERGRYLLIRLLLSDGWLELGEMEDELHVSRTTLESDIKYVKGLVTAQRPYLKLKRGGNCIAIEASEAERRLVLTKLYAESWDYGSKEGVLLQDSDLQPETFQTILERTKCALKRHGLKLDDYDLIAISFTIAVAELRIRTGHPLGAPVAENTDARKIAPMVNELLDELGGALPNTHFDDNERASIMLSLFFRNTLHTGPLSRHELAEVADKRAVLMTELFLRRVAEDYGIDFTWDETLYRDLVWHSYRLENRLRYSYERKSFLLETIKTRFAFFFELSILAYECFRAVYGMDLSEDEWCYFANSLIASANRRLRADHPDGIPVAFVSHLGRSDREMMASQIAAVCGNAIELLGPFSIYEREKIIEAQPKLILSTVEQERVRKTLMDIPHITLSSNLDETMFEKVIAGIRRIQQQHFIHIPAGRLRGIFDERLFFLDLSFSSAEQVIAYLTDQTTRMGFTTPTIAGQVLRRERLSPTALKTGIALPRVCAAEVIHTGIAVASMKRPVMWNGQKISMVLLLLVAQSDIPLFGALIDTLYNDLCQERKKLFGLQSFSQFCELLDA